MVVQSGNKMSSAFFRRPGDDSSDRNSEESQDVEFSNEGTEDAIDGEIGLTATETLSSTVSVSAAATENEDETNIPNVDQHRNLMLATLLEDFYKTRAAEFINSNNPGANYHRQSPEVQALAKKLYVEAGQALSSNGLLPSTATSDGLFNARRQYLAGLDNLSLRQIEDNDLLPAHLRQQLNKPEGELAVAQINSARGYDHLLSNMLRDPAQGLVMNVGKISLSGPQSDMQLSFSQSRRSHYESSFQQLRLLGKGGFGRVYHAYNLFDKKEYAIKKIPLSPKLSQRYRDSGHEELEHVLREMQALAQLEHNNIVRYHATWIEEPRINSPLIPAFHSPPSNPRQKLLENRPNVSIKSNLDRDIALPEQFSDGIVFESASVSQGPTPVPVSADRMLLHSIPNTSVYDTESVHESDIFTDGHGGQRPFIENTNSTMIDQSVYVLHVQMSMYPMTLAEYLAPKKAEDDSHTTTTLSRKHCFHIVPALRILLGILCGLQYIHAKGLIHRDLKPSNIFLSTVSVPDPRIDLLAEGYQDISDCFACSFDINQNEHESKPDKAYHHYVNPRIGDFGLVAHLASSSAMDSSPNFNPKIVGTEFYRPPPSFPLQSGESMSKFSDDNDNDNDESNEKQEKKPNKSPSTTQMIDEKIDVFALGVILVEMLWCCTTSTERMHILRDIQDEKLPLDFLTRLESEEKPSSGSGIGRKLEQVIKGMICRDPNQRLSCELVKIRLEEILHEYERG